MNKQKQLEVKNKIRLIKEEINKKELEIILLSRELNLLRKEEKSEEKEKK